VHIHSPLWPSELLCWKHNTHPLQLSLAPVAIKTLLQHCCAPPRVIRLLRPGAPRSKTSVPSYPLPIVSCVEPNVPVHTRLATGLSSRACTDLRVTRSTCTSKLCYGVEHKNQPGIVCVQFMAYDLLKSTAMMIDPATAATARL
jgi:hypothetical protein